MANNQKPERTEVKDLPVAEQEMSKQEMDKLQGGAGRKVNTSKSNLRTGNSEDPIPPPPPTGLIIDQEGVK